MSCWRSNRASQNPSRPASKATQTRRTTRPARRDSSRQRSINLNSCSGSGGSFFSGSRASPGARAATSQLDWLISMTTINVLSGSRTARDLLRSKGLDMERSIVGLTAAMVHYFRRPPHSISPRKEAGRGDLPNFQRRAAIGGAHHWIRRVHLPELLEFADHALDQRQSDAPEAGISGVEAERLEQLRIWLGAAGRQQREVALRETLVCALINAVQRID